MDKYEVEFECFLKFPGKANCKQLSLSRSSPDRRFDILQHGVKINITVIGQTQPFNHVDMQCVGTCVCVHTYICGFGAMWKPEGKCLLQPTVLLETGSLTESGTR